MATGLTVLTVAALMAAAVMVAVLLLLLLAAFLLAQRLTQHAGVMFGVLEEVLLRHAVAAKLRVAGQREVFVDDLLRRAAHLAFGAGAVEDAVDDVAKRTLPVRLRPRAVFR